MTAPSIASPEPTLRAMTASDLGAVSAIHVANVAEEPSADWRESVLRVLSRGGRGAAALVATLPDGDVVGYAVGEVRSWEFGSPPAGWITGLGVAPPHQHRGVARLLLAAIVARLRTAPVGAIRSMAKRDDVAVLRLFRGAGFAAGPYVELELALEGA